MISKQLTYWIIDDPLILNDISKENIISYTNKIGFKIIQ